MKHNSGFTLAEVVVGVVILGIVTLTINSILVSVFKGTRKAEIVREVKQNGDYALTVMGVKIRQAKRIISVCDTGGATSLLWIRNIDGTSTSFVVDGSILLQQNWNPDDTFDDTANLTSSALTILDVLNAPTLTFACDIQPGKDTEITINFTLRPVQTVGSTQDAQSTQNFSSVFYMQNY